ITTLTPFCASSLPSVPPPAPEPTITTTPLSFRSNFAIVISSLSDLREPVDIGEAALDVTAMLGGGALVAEFRPDLLLIVERHDEVAADGLEELGLLDVLQQPHAIGFPFDLGIGHLVIIARVLVEARDAALDHRLHGGILGGLAVPRLDRGDVVAVDQHVVRIDVARDLYQRLHGRGRQCSRLLSPGVADADTRAGRNGCDRNRGRRALQENAAVIFASAVDLSH